MTDYKQTPYGQVSVAERCVICGKELSVYDKFEELMCDNCNYETFRFKPNKSDSIEQD